MSPAKKRTLKESIRSSMVATIRRLLVDVQPHEKPDGWCDDGQEWNGKHVRTACLREFREFEEWMKARKS